MVRLRYEVVGEGPKVVLLNGLFQRLESWDPVLPHLKGFALVKSRFLWVFLPRPKAGPCPGNAGKPSPP